MRTLPVLFVGFVLCVSGGCSGSGEDVTELTIATVSNPDMRIMEGLASVFEEHHPDIRLNWVVLPENELRTRVTSDVAAGAGSFDVITVGTYEVPIWAENGWIVSVDALMEEFPGFVQPDYDTEDLLTSVRSALAYEGELYALPFYGESSMTFYNKQMFEAAGLEMPEQPTWEQIRRLACQLHEPEEGRYGIVLRGLPGWGEVMAPLTTVVNTFGGRWFDEHWEPQLTSPAWREAVRFYVGLVRACGPPGVTSTGFTEALTLMAQGRAAIWVDATVAAGFLTNPAESQVADVIGFAKAPVGPVPKGNHWLWVWSLAIPTSSQHKTEALRLITWATSKDYIELVGQTKGWDAVPSGTRTSTYQHEAYIQAAPFAPLVLEAIQTADPTDPTRDPVPYVGVQYVGIPEFQGIGTDVSQRIADALVGNATVEEALMRSQAITREAMEHAGYYDERP